MQGLVESHAVAAGLLRAEVLPEKHGEFAAAVDTLLKGPFLARTAASIFAAPTKLTHQDLADLKKFDPLPALQYSRSIKAAIAKFIASTLPEISVTHPGEEDMNAYFIGFREAFKNPDGGRFLGKTFIREDFLTELCDGLEAIGTRTLPLLDKLNSAIDKTTAWLENPNNQKSSKYLPVLALKQKLESAQQSLSVQRTEPHASTQEAPAAKPAEQHIQAGRNRESQAHQERSPAVTEQMLGL